MATQSASPRERNNLGAATSPYLRQHADNPVHWQQWGTDALDWARERDVPVLLSIGYAACHWCHVMAHESFDNDATAELMNANFVCIKVDREERPDIDSIYMSATTAMTGHGGWPLTAFLTSAGEPFYCGTYYPDRPRGGMPSFTQVLQAISDTWRDRREEIDQVSAAVTADLRRGGQLPSGQTRLDVAAVDQSVAKLLPTFDSVAGGFRGAPKFPPSAHLLGLLRTMQRTGNDRVFEAVRRTAHAMARGGIYDQLAGGFARYSVDDEWVVPHFEKMLYDNALLVRAYTELHRVSADQLAGRIVEQTVSFLLRELATSDGGFASALDADAAGVEGSTYAWTPEQLVDVLGDDDGHWAATLFNVTAAGTFEHGASVLQLLSDPDSTSRFDSVRGQLLAARSRRPQPARDDKVVTAWNAMAITALLEAGRFRLASDDRERGQLWIDAARRCLNYLLSQHVIDSRVRRSSLGGVVGSAEGVLEDCGWLVVAQLTAHQVTGELQYLDGACELLDDTIDRFGDASTLGAWFDTAVDSEELIVRPRDPMDGATPAGASVIAEALITASAVAESGRAARYRELADATMDLASVLLTRAPRAAGHWLTVAEAVLHGPLQVAISREPGQSPDYLVDEAIRRAPGGSVIVCGPEGSTPLLVNRGSVDDLPAAYVCHGSICDLPVTSADALSSRLG